MDRFTKSDWEMPCPQRQDKKHCECWYDGRPCCSCGDESLGVPVDQSLRAKHFQREREEWWEC
jgi:hypothetical protein